MYWKHCTFSIRGNLCQDLEVFSLSIAHTVTLTAPPSAHHHYHHRRRATAPTRYVHLAPCFGTMKALSSVWFTHIRPPNSSNSTDARQMWSHACLRGALNHDKVKGVPTSCWATLTKEAPTSKPPEADHQGHLTCSTPPPLGQVMIRHFSLPEEESKGPPWSRNGRCALLLAVVWLKCITKGKSTSAWLSEEWTGGVV